MSAFLHDKIHAPVAGRFVNVHVQLHLLDLSKLPALSFMLLRRW